MASSAPPSPKKCAPAWSRAPSSWSPAKAPERLRPTLPPRPPPRPQESRRPDPRGVLGFAWIDPRGAFGSAPYLKLIAVDTHKRSGGVGSALLAEFERRTLAIGKVWTLMVSDFNLRAIAFYEKHGYRKAGAIPGFAVDGIAEILMVKKKT